MGWTVIQEPDDKFCIYSSISNGVFCWDADEDEIRAAFIERAVEDALRHAKDAMQAARGEGPRVRRRELSYEEAIRWHNETFPNERIEPKERT